MKNSKGHLFRAWRRPLDPAGVEAQNLKVEEVYRQPELPSDSG